MKWILVVALSVWAPASAGAVPAEAGTHTDPVVRARQLASSGHRGEAIQILETRLSARPDDIDARTLLGIVLSWDGQYDRARAELRRVLARDPNNGDAQQALRRIELWSQLKTTTRKSELMLGGNYDDYENSDPWREAYASLKIENRIAPVVLRAARARRFRLNDSQFEIEAYPKFGARTYAYLAAGYSPGAVLYPRSRYGAELFQGFGTGWEASLGARRLNFTDSVNLYTASLGKYAGNWLVSARGYDTKGTKSGQVMARFYFGGAGQYAGLRVGRGSTRDDIRSSSDLASLDTLEVAAETRLVFSGQWLLEARAGAGRASHGRGNRSSVSLALGLRF